MKRDLDKIRQILLYLETSEDGIQITTENKLESTAKLLSQAGFVACYIPNVKFADLTWKGQDFVEIIREESRWNDIKEYIKQKNLPLILDNIIAVSKEKFVLTKTNDQIEDTEEVKERIIKSATKLFGQKHYANTTMLDIAKDAGISRGPLYYYYKTKADLFKAVIREYAENMFKGNLEISEEDLNVDSIRELIEVNTTRIFEYNEANLMSDLFLYDEFKEEAQLIRSHTEGVYNMLVKGGEELIRRNGSNFDFTPRELAGMAMTCYYGVRGLVANEYLTSPIYHLKKSEIKSTMDKSLNVLLTVLNIK